ncbi:MAG: hypothetical protein WBB37_07690 [bacterium]
MEFENNKRFTKFRGAIYLAVLIFIACDSVTVSEYETQLNVYLLLNNYIGYTEAFIDRAYEIDEPSEPYLADALVTISTGNRIDTLIFDELQGKYISWYINILPGSTYCLTVSKQDFDTLYGETTVPGYFHFLNQPGDTITLEDTIIFHRSKGAILYNCAFERSHHTSSFWLKPDTLDRFIKIRVGDHIGSPPEGSCEIRVTAYDRNYYEYHFEPVDSLMQAGVYQGLGLCGSAWQEWITLYLDLPEEES